MIGCMFFLRAMGQAFSVAGLLCFFHVLLTWLGLTFPDLAALVEVYFHTARPAVMLADWIPGTVSNWGLPTHKGFYLGLMMWGASYFVPTLLIVLIVRSWGKGH